MTEETNTAVGNATINIVKGWIPVGKPLVLPVMKCLLDGNMLRALDYSIPPKWLKALVNAAMRARAFMLRKITFKKYPSFVTIEKEPHISLRLRDHATGTGKPG